MRLRRPAGRPRCRRSDHETVAAELLEDRVLPSAWTGLHDFEVIGRTSGGQWWSGGYDSEPQAGETSFQNETFAVWNGGVDWQTVRYGDFDGDTLDDIVGRDPQTGNWYVSLSDGVGSTTRLAGHWSTSLTWSDVFVVDLEVPADRVGSATRKADLIGRASNGQWWAALSNGDGTFSNQLLTTWNEAAGWRDVRVLDVNGDNLPDIVGRTAGGQWFAARSRFGPVSLTYDNVFLAAWSESAGWRDVQVVWKFFGTTDRYSLLARSSGGTWWALTFGLDGGVTTTSVGGWSESAGWRVVTADGATLYGRASSGDWWASSWNGRSLASSRIGHWVESAGWRDVQIARVLDDQSSPTFGGGLGRAIVGRTATGQWWSSRLDGRGMTNVYVGAWDPSAGWRDVRVAYVTRSPVAWLREPAGATTELLTVDILARRRGVTVTIDDWASTGIVRYGIRVVYSASVFAAGTEYFIYPAVAGSDRTTSWLLTFKGHVGDDWYQNRCNRDGDFLALGRAGNDTLRGDENAVRDRLFGEEGADQVFLGPEDLGGD